MTPEELMKPRYKVIADYPGCPYEIGTILYVDEHGELYSPIAGYSQSAVKIMQKEVDKFPHLIKLCTWWEDRMPEDMPEYVNVDHSRGDWVEFTIEHIDGVNRWWDFNEKGECYSYRLKNGGGHLISYMSPATEAEYNAYINKQ